MINWFENVPPEDQPAEYLWSDDKGLEQWFANVRAKRADASDPGTRSGTSDHDPTDQTPEWSSNDQARALREAYK